MDEAPKDQPQVRRVGRPRKNATEAYRDAVAPDLDRLRAEYSAPLAKVTDQRAQVLAVRIWQGQSPDIPKAERLARVMAGLESQGLSMDGVTL